MVFVNDKKYACETCIKGHRSSTCNHTERPLFEIKKKGRPITQCEHCRELRKTKQVHVKCVCEGRDEHDAVSHSIPAKKANRKGPTPSAAFPFGLQSISAPASDSEDSDNHNELKRPKASQTIGSSPSCKCMSSGGSCNCCIPRHQPRSKRSATPPMPRPMIGDIRATMPSLHRPSSDPGDTSELSQRVLSSEPEPHPLSHGHSARLTHGSALFNPYGHAHDAHLRAQDMRGHEPASDRAVDASSGYIYPVPPMSYRQQRGVYARSEPSSAWPNVESLSEDVNNAMSSAFGVQSSEYQSDLLGAVDVDVDVDAWLREMMASSNNPSPTELDTPTSQQLSANASYSDPRTDPQILPIPQALDVSHDLAQVQDPDYASASSQFDLLPRFGNLDLDFNDSYLSGGEQDVSDANGLRPPAAGMFESEAFNYSEVPPSIREVREQSAGNLLNAMSGPFSASAPSLPTFAVQACANEEYQEQNPLTQPQPQPQPQQEYGFDFFLDPDYVVRPDPGLPPLTRSSSIGSHCSSRSRSSAGMSLWTRNESSDRVNTSGNVSNSEQWPSAMAENAWGPMSALSYSETAPGWPATRIRAFAVERGRALAKDKHAAVHTIA